MEVEIDDSAVELPLVDRLASLTVVTWECARTAEGEEVVLRWIQSGLKVQGSGRDGFGMELLGRTLPYDLRAQSSIDFTPTGLHFNLRMSLPSDGEAKPFG